MVQGLKGEEGGRSGIRGRSPLSVAGFRLVWAAGLAPVMGLVACSETPQAPEPTVYYTARFVILDESNAPQDLIDTIGAHLESELDRTAAFLPEFPIPTDTMVFHLLDGSGLPYVSPGTLELTEWRDDLALEYLPHLFVHLLTGYTHLSFLEEGIAVYATEVLEPDSRVTHPYRGQPPHAWVSLFEANGSTIPLSTALAAENLGYDYGGSSPDASAWQLFIEAGSLTRWVFEAYGRDVWFRLYDLQALGVALGGSSVDIERDWLAAARAQYPIPMACEEALATRGPLTQREQFWCARARGE
jgi:hypothetical protein